MHRNIVHVSLDHVSDSLIELHWLPIRWRIQYKFNMLMHGIITGKCPDYLRTVVQPISHFIISRASFGGVPCAEVRHTTSPRLRTQFCERAFSYAGPAAWNSLTSWPTFSVQLLVDRHLRSYLFRQAFNVLPVIGALQIFNDDDDVLQDRWTVF